MPEVGDLVRLLVGGSTLQPVAEVVAVGDCGYPKCQYGSDCVTLSARTKKGSAVTVNRAPHELSRIGRRPE